jgi:DNA polymerase-3 subunit gamma/tau
MANKSINWSISLRPTKLRDVYGLDKLKTFAYKAVKKNEWPEAMLLQAKYGTGKTTAAKILAQMMVCQRPESDGEPCGECPSCKAIVDETWS